MALGLSQQVMEGIARMLSREYGLTLAFHNQGPMVNIREMRIYLPYMPDGAGLPKGFIHQLRYWIDHETGHIAEGSSATLKGAVRKKHGQFAATILNVCEDQRVDHARARKYPGFALSWPLTMRKTIVERNIDSDGEWRKQPLGVQIAHGFLFKGAGFMYPSYISGEARKIIAPFLDEFMDLSLIHISEPTRPY